MVKVKDIKLLFVASVLVLFGPGACSSQDHEGILLFRDIASYSSFDVIARKYDLVEVETIDQNYSQPFLAIAYSKYRFFNNYEGMVRFLFLDNRLMELHFIYDDYAGLIREYFNQLDGKRPNEKYEDGSRVFWFSIDIEMGKYYVGIADSRLREEYKKRLSASNFDEPGWVHSMENKRLGLSL